VDLTTERVHNPGEFNRAIALDDWDRAGRITKEDTSEMVQIMIDLVDLSARLHGEAERDVREAKPIGPLARRRKWQFWRRG
jgi:hypothetical protein